MPPQTSGWWQSWLRKTTEMLHPLCSWIVHESRSAPMDAWTLCTRGTDHNEHKIMLRNLSHKTDKFTCHTNVLLQECGEFFESVSQSIIKINRPAKNTEHTLFYPGLELKVAPSLVLPFRICMQVRIPNSRSSMSAGGHASRVSKQSFKTS